MEPGSLPLSLGGISSSSENRRDSSATRLTKYSSRDSSVVSSTSNKSRVFVKLFNLPADEILLEDFTCAFHKVALRHGRLYVSRRYVCFYSTIFGKLIIKINIEDITAIIKRASVFVFPNAISIETKDGTSYFFTSFLARNSAYDILQKVKQASDAPDETDQQHNQEEEEEKQFSLSLQTPPKEENAKLSSAKSTPPSLDLNDSIDINWKEQETTKTTEEMPKTKRARTTDPRLSSRRLVSHGSDTQPQSQSSSPLRPSSRHRRQHSEPPSAPTSPTGQTSMPWPSTGPWVLSSDSLHIVIDQEFGQMTPLEILETYFLPGDASEGSWKTFYENVLNHREIEIGEWGEEAPQQRTINLVSEVKDVPIFSAKETRVKVMQKYSLEEEGRIVRIWTESQSFDVPYAESFMLLEAWEFRLCTSNGSHCKVETGIAFFKSLWGIQGIITKKCREGTKDALTKWMQFATKDVPPLSDVNAAELQTQELSDHVKEEIQNGKTKRWKKFLFVWLILGLFVVVAIGIVLGGISTSETLSLILSSMGWISSSVTAKENRLIESLAALERQLELQEMTYRRGCRLENDSEMCRQHVDQLFEQRVKLYEILEDYEQKLKLESRSHDEL